MKIKHILILAFTFIMASSAFSQASQTTDLNTSEELLKSILQKRDSSSDWDVKEKLEKEFEEELLSVLRQKESRTYQFSKLPIKTASSGDGKLNIYTWDTKLGGTHIRLAGIVQWLDGSNNLNTRLLNDESALLGSDSDTIINTWIGALYSEVHPLTFSGETCYLAIGWTTWGSGTQTKVVEVFEPSGKDIIIGKPIFQFEGSRKARLLFIYARAEEMRLNYDPESKILKFDNLVEPTLEGASPGWRKPDGTIRKLEFKRDCFQEIGR